MGLRQHAIELKSEPVSIKLRIDGDLKDPP